MMEHPEVSRDLALKGIELSQETGINKNIGLFYKRLGASYYYLGRYADALKNLSKARNIFLAQNNDQQRANCVFDMGLLYSRMQHFDSAITYLLRAQNLYIKNGDTSGPMFCLSEIGVLYFQSEDFNKALEYFLEAYELSKAQSDSSEIVKNLGFIGGAYMYLNQMRKAERAFKRCLNLSKNSSYATGISDGLNHLGVLYEKKGQFDSSRAFFFQDRKLILKTKDRHQLAGCEGNIGVSHFKQGQYDSALYWTSKKLFLAKKLKDTVLLADALFTQAQFFAAKNRMDSAFHKLNNHLELSKSIQNRRRIDLLENFRLKNELSNQGRELLAFENQTKVQQLEIKRKNGLLLISILSAGLLLGMSMFFLYYRQQKHKEARIFLELQMLRSRINPHNLFNAFNSIQSLFITKEYEKGQDYLRKFAHLLRMLLQKSENMFHTLSEELEYVKLYMEVERLGMDNDFKFIINLDENLDIENTLIPTLISQTYLENAIHHGIFNSGTKGTVELKANMYKGVLHWAIRDNGIGISESAKQQETNGKVHKSQGLKLNQSLLKLLSKGNKLKYTVTINELFSGQDVVGTEVVLEIPQSD